MTIAAGFVTGSAAIICADSREVIGNYAKSTTHKLRVTSFDGNWRLGIAGASDHAHYLDLFQDDLSRNLSNIGEFEHYKVVSIIKATLLKLHKQHIWPRRWDKPNLQMLIAVQGIKPIQSVGLLATEDSAVIPVDDYQSIGIGTYLAKYVYERLDPSTGGTYVSSPDRMANLGVFILQQVKKSVQGCDGETTVGIFYADGTFRWMTTDEVHEMESWMTQLDHAVEPLWWHIANPDMREHAFKHEVEQMNMKLTAIRARQTLAAPKRAQMADFLDGQRKSIEDSMRSVPQKSETGEG